MYKVTFVEGEYENHFPTKYWLSMFLNGVLESFYEFNSKKVMKEMKASKRRQYREKG